MRALIAFLLAALAIVCIGAKAAVQLPPAPPLGWCAASVANGVYKDVTACTTPPIVVPPGVEEPGRLHFAVVQYPNIPGPTGTGISRDVRLMTEIAGHGTNTGAALPWPYTSAVPLIKNVPRGGYVSAQFVCGNDGKAVTVGLSTYGNSPMHPILSWISARPGAKAPDPTAGNPHPAPYPTYGPSYPGVPIYKIVVAPKVNGFSCSPGVPYYWNWLITNDADKPYHDLQLTFGSGPNP